MAKHRRGCKWDAHAAKLGGVGVILAWDSGILAHNGSGILAFWAPMFVMIS